VDHPDDPVVSYVVTYCFCFHGLGPSYYCKKQRDSAMRFPNRLAAQAYFDELCEATRHEKNRAIGLAEY
jgi:hypothetical protein